MKIKLTKIGNSFGIIISKKILDQINAKNEVSLSVEDSKIIIQAVKLKPRKDWEEMLLKANSLQDNDALDYFENDFDKTVWTW